MADPIELALEEARKAMADGRGAEAESAYARAAELARTGGDQAQLAHALRHLSDLARSRGDGGEAFRHASDATALYRDSDDRLGLANAIRLQALSAPSTEQASAYWSEARGLYAGLEVDAGVAECDRRLKP